MKLRKGQKRPKVFTLELVTEDEDDSTIVGIFSTPALAKRYLNAKLDKGTPLMKMHPLNASVIYSGWNREEAFGYRIVKWTVDGRIERNYAKKG